MDVLPDPLPGPMMLTPVPELPAPLTPREGLVARLAAVPDSACAAVSAAPGYGRTTLLAMVARRTAGLVAWVSVGPWPDEPAALLSHLAAVFGDGSPGGCGSLPELVDEMVRRVSDAGCGGRGLLVIDDLDSTAQPQMTRFVARLADGLPPGWRLLVGLRRAVPGELARLGRRGKLLTIDQPDMVLSHQQSADLVTMLAPWLSEQARERLIELAEGWPAAIVEALQGPAGVDPVEPSGWLLSVGVERLLDPVFHEMDLEDADFLMRCSVLPVLDADSCAAVTGDPDAPARLRRLHEARCYLRRSDGGVRLAMHGLLAEYLQRALSARGAGVAAEVRSRAAGVAVQAGDPAAAIRHLIDAGKYDEALSLIEVEVASAMDNQQVATVRAWYARVPAGTHALHTHLLAEAWSALFLGDIPGAEKAMAGLEVAVAETVGDGADLIPGSAASYGASGWLAAQVHVLRSYRASWLGLLGQTRREAQAARRLFGESWGPQAVVVATLLVVRERLWVEDVVAARPVLTEAMARLGTSHYFRVVGYPSVQALAAAIEGRPWRGAYLADQVLDYLDSQPEGFAVGPMEALLARSRARVDVGDASRGLADAVSVVQRAECIGHIPYAVLGRTAAARAMAGAGQLGAGQEHLARASALLRGAAPSSPLRDVVNALAAEIHLMRGELPAAERLIRRLPRGNGQALLRVRLIQARRPGAGLAELATLQPESPRQAAQAAALRAAAGFVNGRITDAERHLVTAGEISEETGMATTLIGASPELLGFADRMARRSRYQGLGELVAVARTWDAAHCHPSSILKLSPGERQLLQLLADRQRTAAIAEQLGVSVNTIKTRLARLYRKLGANSRWQALSSARELNLLSPGP